MNVPFRYLLISEYSNKSNRRGKKRKTKKKKTTSLINVQQKFVVFVLPRNGVAHRVGVGRGGGENKRKVKRKTHTSIYIYACTHE